MDAHTVTPLSAPSSTDENQRVKFLCSFSGSILPRPGDGKLRYVGGETRIVSAPRDIGYEGLMSKMKELFEGVFVLKYQQPDEDLDALVSVVNDDDVTNMMEEYDKLGSGDGFTRLRIFLFANSEQDSSLHFVDGDEKDYERRYVDALNSLNESPDFRKAGLGELSSFDDVHSVEQYINPMNLDGGGGVHVIGQRNMELPMAQMNLRHLTIPHLASGQPVNQRFNEMDAPWSPGYYSPRQPELPISPSSSRYRTLYSFSEKRFDRMPHEDYNNVVLIPGVPEKAGFPGDILQASSGVYDGKNSMCENCRMAFQRNQVYPDSSFWKPPTEQPPHLEAPNVGNGYNIQIPNSCAECVPPYYCRDQNDPRAIYNETHGHERGWVSPHQPNLWADERGAHSSLTGRFTDGYVMENGMSVQSHCVHHEEQHYVRPGVDYVSQVFQDQPVNPRLSSSEDRGVRYGNPPAYTYGNDNLYQGPHGNFHPQSPWRHVHSPFQVGPSYEVNSSVPMSFIRESSPRASAGVKNQNSWTESSRKGVGFDGSLMPEYSHVQTVQVTPNIQISENQNPHLRNSIQSASVAPFGANGNSEREGNEENNNGGEGNDSGVCEVQEPAFENGGGGNETNNASVHEGQPDDRLEFLPELIASVKEAALQSLKVVKDKVQEDSDLGSEGGRAEKEDNAQNHKDGVDGNMELEIEDDTDNVDNSKIELTKAEEEALDRGLQTIKNEDLEEIRELGSGTYGSVYHGKWKGSDVAIKRIKASCFAGRPSERERLIADFWKEALILSSLHHPNVVSFYGVVRDGPDGSLATVTEFMVNGSLKQFLQKKDRTIDRRKRLIIAMDAAFGMEYLHGKNIVHFDLKCENLLVNMRDPHRPVCKIGDLGLSKVKQHTLVSGGVRGTLPWMAPELLSGKSNMVTEKIDVYSFGICMWELLTGDEPYTDMHCASIIGGIVNNMLRPQIPTWCDPEWKALMESCWASDPTERPSFSEIVQKLRNMAAAMNLK